MYFRPCLVVLFPAVAAGQPDGDIEAAVGHGGGVHGSVVDGGDGRHQGETQTEAVVAGAVVEPGEREEQAGDLVGWYGAGGVGDAFQWRAVGGAGRDGYAAG